MPLFQVDQSISRNRHFHDFFTKIDFYSVVDVLSHANIFYLLIALLLMVIGVLIIAKRWQTILETMGYNFRYKECFNLIMAAFSLTSITPSKSGDIIKAYYLKDKIPASKTVGGVILIGISDRGEIKGVSVGKETLKEWVNKISQSTEPALIPEIETYVIEGKTVVAITIKESPLKPIAYKGICFLIIKNSKKKLSPKEVSELYLQTIGSSWDAYSARDAKIEDIDREKVRFYIKSANETGRREITEESLEWKGS